MNCFHIKILLLHVVLQDQSLVSIIANVEHPWFTKTHNVNLVVIKIFSIVLQIILVIRNLIAHPAVV